MRLKATLFTFFICHSLTTCLLAQSNDQAKQARRLDLSGKNISIRVNRDLSLTVGQPGTGLLWESSKTRAPNIVVRANDAKPRTLTLASATKVSHSPFDDGKYRGHTVHLSGFDETDVELDLVFAIDATADELLIQIAQAGGRDTVVSVGHFYKFEKLVTDGGYMVLPHGSGYLIAAECPDELQGPQKKSGGFGRCPLDTANIRDDTR